MIYCSTCAKSAESEQGVIHVRLQVIWGDFKKWSNLPVCRKCFDKYGGRQ